MRGLVRITGTVAVVAAALVLVASAAGQPGSPAALAWSPDLHSFGTVGAGGTASQQFTLTNTGGSASGVLSVSLSGSEAFSITADACTRTVLRPGRSCAVTVEYAPAEEGQNDAATLSASAKRPATAIASASLTGAGGVPVTPDLVLTPGSWRSDVPGLPKLYDFDFDPSASATQTFTVTNFGDGASETLLVTFFGDPPGFVLSNDTCSGIALPGFGTSCTFDVTATAPAACAFPQSFGPAVVEVLGILDWYITLSMRGFCPFP